LSNAPSNWLTKLIQHTVDALERGFADLKPFVMLVASRLHFLDGEPRSPQLLQQHFFGFGHDSSFPS
jgi:hypothetical protein